MKTKLGYIKETAMNYFDESNTNSQENLFIDKNNVIESSNVGDNFEYYNQSTQQTENKEDFDYTLLKVIIFLIFV